MPAHRTNSVDVVFFAFNMLLSISDFGLALVQHSMLPVSEQQLAGTSAYMAPEQRQGYATAASDQYALAVMVYEWLLGTA